VREPAVLTEAAPAGVAERSRRRREPLALGLVTAVAGAALGTLLPPAGDAPAHLWRVVLLREGAWVWDGLWYGGHYPFASYSLLYYPLAAVAGHVPLAAAACGAAAALFAALVTDEWGRPARWSARAFAVFALTPVLTGTYSYAVGLATLLGAVWWARRGRTGRAAVAAAATMALSPLAFAFLLLAAVAVAVASHGAALRSGSARRALAALGVIIAGELAVLAAFPSPGRYPFPFAQLGQGLGICVLGGALAARARLRVLVAFFAVWAAACVVAFAVPSAFGANLLRLRALVFPLFLLPAALAWPGERLALRLLALPMLALGFVYSVAPQVMAVATLVTRREEATAAFWAPLAERIKEGMRPGHRVEVVPTRRHWEAYWLPRAGLALARGWNRQLDMVANPAVYEPDLDAARYRAWLDARAVRYVVLVRTDPDAFGARREAALVRDPATGLRPVWRSARFTLYEVPGAVPMLTGPGAARVRDIGPDGLAGWLARPGTYTLRVRPTRYWAVEAGRVCVAPGPGGTTLVRAAAAGPFRLAIVRSPAAVARALVDPPAACGQRDTAIAR
jgi:hypothetical protein